MSSPLHECSVEQLRARLTTAELAALPKAVGVEEGEEGAIDAWLLGILMAACDRVVGAVNACERNARIAYGRRKVPAPCVHTAYVLARHAVISCIPGKGQLLEGSSREAEYRQACDTLNKLAACELDVGDYSSDPDAGSPPRNYLHTRPAMQF